MEGTDRELYTGLLARRIGAVVSEVLGDRPLDEDVCVSVLVENPSCYFDEKGVFHNGRLVTVSVDFMEECGDD